MLTVPRFIHNVLFYFVLYTAWLSLLALTNKNPSVFQMLSPGYSYDTAYVEFLNLEDAVHFMESNKVAHPRHYEGPLSQQDFGGLRRLLVERGGGGDGVL